MTGAELAKLVRHAPAVFVLSSTWWGRPPTARTSPERVCSVSQALCGYELGVADSGTVRVLATERASILSSADGVEAGTRQMAAQAAGIRRGAASQCGGGGQHRRICPPERVSRERSCPKACCERPDSPEGGKRQCVGLHALLVGTDTDNEVMRRSAGWQF